MGKLLTLPARCWSPQTDRAQSSLQLLSHKLKQVFFLTIHSLTLCTCAHHNSTLVEFNLLIILSFLSTAAQVSDVHHSNASSPALMLHNRTLPTLPSDWERLLPILGLGTGGKKYSFTFESLPFSTAKEVVAVLIVYLSSLAILKVCLPRLIGTI